MHRVRLAVRVNRLTTSVITEDDYGPAIEQTGRGWVAEEDGVILGVAVGNRLTGDIWALFVDPAHEKRRIGSRLQAAMVDGCSNKASRASGGAPRSAPGHKVSTRHRAGPSFIGMSPDGEAEYELHRPRVAA